MAAEANPNEPIGDRVDETVRRSIKGLIAGRRVDKADVADAVGMGRTTMYQRLAGHGSTHRFTDSEIASLAAFFHVPVGDLYEGFGGVFLAPPDPGEWR